jgi:hypothetical protein
MEDELAKAYAKPEEFTDYTPDQLKQIQGLQAAGGYDVQAVPGAEGQAPTLRYTARPESMYYDDMGQPEAPIEIAPQRVQRYGGQTVAGQFNPTELRGLQMQEAARVLGSYGDVRGAAALQAQADEQAYQARIRPLQEEQLRGSIAGQAQQRNLTGLQLKAAERTEGELQNAANFSNFAAANPNLTTAQLKDAAFKEFKFTPKQWQDAVNTRLGISDTEQKLFVAGIKDKLKGKNLQQLGSLYNSDPDFDDKTDLAIVPGKGGAVTLNFIDKASGRVTSTQSFKNEALATEYLNKQATEPENIGSWMLALQKTQSGIDAQQAQIRASDATVGLRSRQMQMLSDQAAGNAEAQQIRARYDALTPEEQVGPAGQGLIRQFNMANAKAGTPVPLGSLPRAERPEVSAAAVASYAKDLVGKPSGEMKDGKPVRYTAETAAAAARRALSSQDGATADPADALIEAMRRNAPTQQRATPAGQSLVNLSNAMLPPAAPAATAPTTSQERLRGLYLGQ